MGSASAIGRGSLCGRSTTKNRRASFEKRGGFCLFQVDFSGNKRGKAERAGFEPAVAFATRHFESRTIDHSDISPRCRTARRLSCEIEVSRRFRRRRGSNAPGENRTPDALLRTEALYPLSYEGKRNAVERKPNANQTDAPGGTRTPGLQVRNLSLYPLSYGRASLQAAFTQQP